MKWLVFLLIPINLFSQSNIDDIELKSSIERICKGKFATFHKAHEFYFNKKTDSAYIYSSKASFFDKETEINDFSNFIYGVSASKKGFYSIAEDKLNNISSEFPFQHLVYYNLGITALRSNKFEKSLNYYRKALNYHKIKSNAKLKIIYHNIGICYLHLNNFKKAEDYLKKEVEIAKLDNDTLGLLHAKLDLGNAYYEQHKDNQAIALFEEAYNLSQIHTDLEAKQAASENMAIVEKHRNNYKKSLEYLEQSMAWKDSIWNKNKISLLLEKDKQQIVTLKEKEVQIQKEHVKFQKKQNNWFLGGSIVLLSLLGLLLYFYRIKTRQNEIITTQKQQLEKLNNTKNYLFSVVSHDLRSPVNSINYNNETLNRALSNNNIQEALKLNSANITISKNTSHLLNNILNWALEQNDQLLFSPQFHAIDILIESVLFDYKPLALNKNIELTFLNKDSGTQVFLDQELFKITFRNLIDNAIKFTPEDGKITIETSTSDKACFIIIKDTGAGMPPEILKTINNYETLTIEKIDRSKGLGLGLLLSKVLTLKNNGTFQIKNSDDKGIIITLGVPIKKI
ncbi:tetratricopeptide repeat-containing sensor histidine kinase [Flavivirga eckloniae]|uniref:histidine kinase n=1 Tax=Flavivirga eckloniae TaxID=1803846 RepID=A0A2K9PPV5_9FLAO|nr:tetratricopeptide repeat-containing sensor histidine kinase [Flavivirga eckloniae]AUP78597.1 hypothetical protein C1H87_07680 [Flavivirga eckloniae]